MKSSDWDERYRSAELVWGAEPNQFVRQQCERLPVGLALDLACGEGRNALWLARLGWKVHGIDISSVAIERARDLTRHQPGDAARRLSWEVADVTTTPLPVSKVDLVVLSYAQLEAAERELLVRASARAVRPSGRVLVVGHDRRNLTEGVGGPQDADRLFVPAEVAEQLDGEGLLVEVAETVPRHTADGVALDTLVRARRPVI